MTEKGTPTDEAQETVNRIREAFAPAVGAADFLSSRGPSSRGCQNFDFGTLPEYELLKIKKAAGEIAGIENPYILRSRSYRARPGD